MKIKLNQSKGIQKMSRIILLYVEEGLSFEVQYLENIQG